MSLSSRARRALPTVGAVLLIMALLVAGGLVVHATGGTKAVYPHLLYIPVVIAGLLFGGPGGLVVGLAAGLVVGPWMPLDVEAGLPQQTAGWMFRTGFFVLIGVLTGTGQRLLEEHRQRVRTTRRELRLTESRLRALVDAVSDYAIITLDPTGRVVTWNVGAERIFGYQAAEIAGDHFDRFYPPGDDLPARELATAVSDGRCEVEGWRLRQDGSQFWANTVVTPLLDPDGRLEGFAKVTRDMTQAKEAREHLEELLRYKDEFIAAVAHELRTPLTAVVGFAGLLASGELSDGDPQGLAAEIHSQATDLAGIVDDLLVAARIEIGRLWVSPAPVDLGKEVLSLVESLPGAAQRIQIHGDGRALADRSRLRQVLRNLLSNALRYGGDRVTVIVSAAGGTASIQVRDDGSGVPENDRERIFIPYETSGDRPGQPSRVGLGLTVSRKLARLMGGDLSYRREGEESIFELVLPLIEADISLLAG